MLYYDQIDTSEDKGINKTSDSHECMTFQHNRFFKINFRSQPFVCDDSHDCYLQKYQY